MALQRLDLGPSLSENITSALGTGLQALTHNKLDQMQKQQRAMGISSVLGIDPQQAQAYAGLPDALLQPIFKQHMQNQAQQQFENQLPRYENQSYNQPYGQQFQPQQNQQIQPSPTQASNQSISAPPENQQRNLPNNNQPNQFQYQEPKAPKSLLVPKGLTPQQHIQYQNHLTSEQKRVDQGNKPFLIPFIKRNTLASEMKDIFTKMYEDWSTGKVLSGWKGDWIPKYWQNRETQRYSKNSKQLVQKSIQNAGLPTKFKIQYGEEQKPSLDQRHDVQGDLILEGLETVNKILAQQDIYDQILADNGGEQPPNIESLINRRYKQMTGEDILNEPGRIAKGLGKSENNAPMDRSEENNIEQEPQNSLNEYNSENESAADTIGRNISRIPSRLIPFLLTIPQAPIEFGLSLGKYLNTKSGNKKPQSEEEIIKDLEEFKKSGSKMPMPSFKEIYNKLEENDPGLFKTWEEQQARGIPLPPTYEQYTKGIDKLTGGYTKPQSVANELTDGIINTAAALWSGNLKDIYSRIATPLLGVNKATKVVNTILPYSQRTWQQSLKLGAAGEIVGRGLKEAGAGPLIQAVGKLGTMIFMDTAAGGKAAESEKINKYKEANDAIGNPKSPRETRLNKELYSPKNLVDISKTRHKIRDLYEKVEKGDDPNREVMMEFLKDNERVLENMTGTSYNPKSHSQVDNLVPVNELMDLKITNNKWYGLSERPRVPGEKHFPKGARYLIGEANGAIKEPLDKFGIKNPKFGEPFSVAEDLHAAQQDVSFINKFMDENFSATLGLKNVFSKVLSLGASYAGIAEIDRIRNIIMNHPVYRRVYFDALADAAQNNLTAFLQHAKQLDKMGEEYEKKHGALKS